MHAIVAAFPGMRARPNVSDGRVGHFLINRLFTFGHSDIWAMLSIEQHHHRFDRPLMAHRQSRIRRRRVGKLNCTFQRLRW